MVRANRRSFFGLAGAAVAGTAIAGVQLTSESSASTANLGLATEGSAPLGGPSTPTYKTLEPFRDPLRIPPVLRPSGDGITEIRLVGAEIRLHSQLPPTPMWTYEGHYPGPTIEVPQNRKIRIAWQNQLDGTTPVRAVYTPPRGGVGPVPGLLNANEPGRGGAPLRPEIAELTPWITTHLHGGHQHAFADGMADCGVIPGNAQLVEYGNDGNPAHLFYHDHAMPVTAVNFLSGLMGHYIIKDPRGDRLGLPQGKYDIPLAIADVNFDTDDQGRIDGHLLSKRVQLAPRVPGKLPLAVAFLGPFNMVNGVVFPYLDVEPTAYLFRMLNSSTGFRFYSLAVVDEATGKPVNGVMKVVGTDVGLLDEPRTIDQTLSLGPAERADIVIDFSAFPGKRLRLVNTVAGVPAGVPVPAAGVPNPEVMQFRVAARPGTPYVLPQKLSDFKRITPADVPADATERFALLSFNEEGMPALFELQEIAADTPAGNGILQIVPPGDKERTFQIVASRFEDTITFFSAASDFQKWTFINASPSGVPITHPMHIHMIDFQIIARNAADISGYDSATQQTTTPITALGPLPIAPEESGLKDTVAVPINTFVTVAGRLARQTGRFMYHCHILDHEDEGMMRPHTIMPPTVLNMQNLMMATMPGTSMP